MYCIRCGKKLEDGAQCCIHCGARVTASNIRKPGGEDDFTISIPEGFIQPEFARSTQVQTEEMPDDAGDVSFTQMMSKKEIRRAIAEQKQQDSKTAGDDIPIPTDFVVLENTGSKPSEKSPQTNTQSKNTQKTVVYHAVQEEGNPAQLMSGRSILLVVIAVVLLFAIAIGAFLISLNGKGADAADTASGSADVGFWSYDADS